MTMMKLVRQAQRRLRILEIILQVVWIHILKRNASRNIENQFVLDYLLNFSRLLGSLTITAQ